jgi:hypothetical protein
MDDFAIDSDARHQQERTISRHPHRNPRWPALTQDPASLLETTARNARGPREDVHRATGKNTERCLRPQHARRDLVDGAVSSPTDHERGVLSQGFPRQLRRVTRRNGRRGASVDL